MRRLEGYRTGQSKEAYCPNPSLSPGSEPGNRKQGRRCVCVKGREVEGEGGGGGELEITMGCKVFCMLQGIQAEGRTHYSLSNVNGHEWNQVHAVFCLPKHGCLSVQTTNRGHETKTKKPKKEASTDRSLSHHNHHIRDMLSAGMSVTMACLSVSCPLSVSSSPRLSSALLPSPLVLSLLLFLSCLSSFLSLFHVSCPSETERRVRGRGWRVWWLVWSGFSGFLSDPRCLKFLPRCVGMKAVTACSLGGGVVGEGSCGVGKVVCSGGGEEWGWWVVVVGVG